jgi:catechol 2,3-dioxygenase-like lactoylglutathione lyase family enzyme
LEPYFRRDEASRTRSALEVGDIEQALDFYGNIFDFKLRGRGEGATFIDLGDPIHRPYGGTLAAQRRRTEFRAGSRRPIDRGNRILVVEYKDLQFTNTSGVLHSMGLDHLRKTEEAKRQLTAKGIVDAL